MKRSYFRQPSTVAGKGTPPSNEAFSLDALRARLLSRILVVALIMGFIAFFASLPGRIQQREWGVILGFTMALGWMVVITLLPRIGYRIRAASLVLAIALVGLVTLLADGLYGSGRVYFLAVPVATGLVLSAQGSIPALILSVVVFEVTGLMMVGGIIPAPSLSPGAENINLGAWLVAGASLALVGTTITVSLTSILHGLEASLNKEKRLKGELDVERARLEHRVLQRTQDLERRLVQIRTATEIIRSIGIYLKPEQLLPKVVDLVKERFNLYYVGVFLLDEQSDFAVLHAGSGEAGAAMLEAGHQLAVDETSMVGWSIQHQQARIALDVGFEAVHFNNPLLPLTRSELALPLLGGRGVLGAMSVQSSEAKAFDQDDITVLQGIADALATALENASLFQQLERSLEEIQTLHRQYLLEAWKDVAREEENRQFSTGARKTITPDLVQASGVKEHRIPIKLRDQEIGQLTLEVDRPELTGEEQAFIEAVTTQAAVALENVRLLEKNQRQAGYERLLSDISRKARSSTDLDTILRVTIKELGQVLGATDGMIRLEIPVGGEEEVRL